MIKINLLPVRESQKKEKLREQVVVLVACVAFVVIGCGAAYTTVLTKISQKNDVIAEQTKMVEQLQKQIGEVEKVKKLQAELQSKLDILDTLKANKTGPAHMLDELSNATPEKLWIDQFDDVDGGVSLGGLGVNEEVVANFLQRLESSPYYKNVELQSLEQTVLDGNKLHKFKIAARDEAPPVAKASPEKKPESKPDLQKKS